MLLLKNVVFDLDNTLYPPTTRVNELTNERFVRYVSRVAEVDEATARRMMFDWGALYDEPVLGLHKEYGVSIPEAMEYSGDVDLASVEADTELAGLIKRMPQQKFIYTNNIFKHVKDTLAKLTIDIDDFSGIATYDRVDCRFKPAADSFRLMLELFKIQPRDSVFLEDKAANLKTAKGFGLTTVLITPQETSLPYVDYVFPSATAAVRALFL